MSRLRTVLLRLLTLLLLTGLACGLAAGLVTTVAGLSGPRALTAAERRGLRLLVLVEGVLLALVVLCLAWFLIRLISQHLAGRQSRKGPTNYSNAWEIAGERFELKNDETE